MAQAANVRSEEARTIPMRGEESRNRDTRNDSARSEETWEMPFVKFVPAEVAEFSKKRLEALVEMQKELLETIGAMNQAWFERAKSEAELASELVSKLSDARSMPETANVCQECMGKKMDLLVDDGRRLFADSQKFIDIGARFLRNGSAKDAA